MIALLAPLALVLLGPGGAPALAAQASPPSPLGPPSGEGVAEPAALPIAQQAALRCSIAIALAAERQRNGETEGRDWPDLTERGREFFVRSLAQVMEDAGLTREALMALGRDEAEELQRPGRLDEVMPACLLMLEASGL